MSDHATHEVVAAIVLRDRGGPSTLRAEPSSSPNTASTTATGEYREDTARAVDRARPRGASARDQHHARA